MYSTCVKSVMLHAAETCMQQRLGHDGDYTKLPSIGSVISRQSIKLAQTPFSQSLASKTWMWCSAQVG